MNPMGGVGQQVADTFLELGKSAATNATKLGTDVMKNSFEQVLSGGVNNPDSNASPGKSAEPGPSKEQTKAIKKQEESKRFQQVKNELAEYTQRKAQLDAQISREKDQEHQQQEQKNIFEKRKKESFLQKLMGRLGRGSHGETDRQKE